MGEGSGDRGSSGRRYSLSKGTELRNSLICAKELQGVCCGWNMKFEAENNEIYCRDMACTDISCYGTWT